MNDGMDYIRRAIAQYGPQARVEVVRWEMDRKTGYHNRPVKVITNATNALKNLAMPLNKRSRIWRMVLPLGVNPGNVSTKPDLNSLSDPALIDELKAQVRAEILAEMNKSAAKTVFEIPDEIRPEEEEKAKKPRKKKVAVIDESNELDVTDESA